jgi:hypothetical protein
MGYEICDHCGSRVTAEEAALGWPIVSEYGTLCPACFGEEAYCRCGAVLPATDDCSECDACAREREAERLRAVEIWKSFSAPEMIEITRERPGSVEWIRDIEEFGSPEELEDYLRRYAPAGSYIIFGDAGGNIWATHEAIRAALEARWEEEEIEHEDQ